ncbi:MAG: rhodanese-like domain-containing protein [Opitutales bacterium]|jgi:membrane protein DedA with SNARE-associated domain/rhodanese-related sulfurtransferase
MDDTMQFLVVHGGMVLFAVIFVEQIGLPMPAGPWLMAAGALAAHGKMDMFFALGVTLWACVVADGIWYEIGRRGGKPVLRLLCKMSLEADTRARQTENLFEQHGVGLIVASKFLPWLGTLIPPLAGIFRIGMVRFQVLNAVGAVMYGACFLGLGFMFSDQIEVVGQWLARLGGWGGVVLAGLAALYIGYKYWQRHRVVLKLRMARVTPEEVYQKQEAGESPYILDLRSPSDLRKDPVLVRGAVYISFDEVRRRHGEIPRDRDIVVYCTCPNEATAARMALFLQQKGIKRVRPLLGGIQAWQERKYPTVAAQVTVGEKAG